MSWIKCITRLWDRPGEGSHTRIFFGSIWGDNFLPFLTQIFACGACGRRRRLLTPLGPLKSPRKAQQAKNWVFWAVHGPNYPKWHQIPLKWSKNKWHSPPQKQNFGWFWWCKSPGAKFSGEIPQKHKFPQNGGKKTLLILLLSYFGKLTNFQCSHRQQEDEKKYRKF